MHKNLNSTKTLLISLFTAIICFALAACNSSFSFGGSNASQCQSNCVTSSGVQGVRVYVEPNDGEQ